MMMLVVFRRKACSKIVVVFRPQNVYVICGCDLQACLVAFEKTSPEANGLVNWTAFNTIAGSRDEQAALLLHNGGPDGAKKVPGT
jgi:hypothetical protein